MTTYVALLRGVNLVGRSTLKMADLKAIADELKLERARTYIASGNLLFESDLAESTVKRMLEQRLAEYAGKPVGVMVRTAEEIAAVVAANPFADQPPGRVVAIFLDSAPPKSALTEHKHLASEWIALGRREIYVHYPDGLGRSRLAIKAAAAGTARNMNSVARLAEMARG